MSCVRRADRPALTTRRAVHVMNAIAVGWGQCMLVVCIGDLFIDPAQVARVKGCVVRGVRRAAQVAGDRTIGLGREERRQRRDPREKELQDQRACQHWPEMPKLGNSRGIVIVSSFRLPVLL